MMEHRRSDSASTIVYNPGLRATLSLKAARTLEMTAVKSLRLGLGHEMDDYFVPMRPGNLISVIGMSGHGKSAVMQFVARKCAQQIKDQERTSECVVVVTWEQTIEEMGLLDMGRLCGITLDDFARGKVPDWTPVEQASVDILKLPIFTVGHSLEYRRENPNITLDHVVLALRGLEDSIGIKPALIVLDYLQGIDPDPHKSEQDRRLTVRSDIYAAKNMAFEFGCPVIVGCQAKQMLMERAVQLPGQYDAEETSAVAQKSDAIIGLWMPKKAMQWGKEIKVGEHKYIVKDDLLLVLVAKQRFGPDGRHFAFHLDGALNEIRPWEDRYE